MRAVEGSNRNQSGSVRAKSANEMINAIHRELVSLTKNSSTAPSRGRKTMTESQGNPLVWTLRSGIGDP